MAKEFADAYGNKNIITPSSFFLNSFRLFGEEISAELKKHEIDLFHGLSHEIPYGLKKQGIRAVVTILDLIFMRYPEYFPWIDRRVYLSKVKHAVNEADCVVAICEQTKNDLINFLQVDPNKIEICYQSCHEQFQKGPTNASEIGQIKTKYNLGHNYFCLWAHLRIEKIYLT